MYTLSVYIVVRLYSVHSVNVKDLFSFLNNFVYQKQLIIYEEDDVSCDAEDKSSEAERVPPAADSCHGQPGHNLPGREDEAAGEGGCLTLSKQQDIIQYFSPSSSSLSTFVRQTGMPA